MKKVPSSKSESQETLTKYKQIDRTHVDGFAEWRVILF